MRSSIGSVAAIAAVLAAVSLSACGGSAHAHADAPPPPKPPRAARTLTPSQIACIAPTRAAMADYLHVAATAIGEAASVGGNAMPQCRFRTRLANRRTVDVLVNVDNGPSAYFRLMRTEVEDSQPFPNYTHPPAASVLHLGLEAAWFPQYPQLMATDGHRLITVAVTWRHEPQRDDRALAIAMVRPFLHTPHGKAAAAIANDYP